jgi:hypothetical protein
MLETNLFYSWCVENTLVESRLEDKIIGNTNDGHQREVTREMLNQEKSIEKWIIRSN